MSQRTGIINQIRAFLLERGIAVRQGQRFLRAELPDILENPLIDSSYRRMHNYLRLVRLDRKLTVPLALRSIQEHIAIIDACAERDPEAAEAAPLAHFTAAVQRLTGLF